MYNLVKTVVVGLGIVWAAMLTLEMSTISVLDANKLVSSYKLPNSLNKAHKVVKVVQVQGVHSNSLDKALIALQGHN